MSAISADMDEDWMYPTRPHGDSTLALIVNAFFTALSFVVALVALPFLLPVSLMFRLWRNYLDEKVMLETRGEAEICSGDDAVWLQDSPENKAIINSLFELGGSPDVEKFRDVIGRRFVFVRDANGDKMFPKATRYLNYKNSRPVWIEERFFDMKDHVYLWEKTSPKNEQELNDLIGYLASQPVPEHLARWQIILIPPITSDDVPEEKRIHYMIFRVHHSVGDGVSLVKVLVKQLMDAVPEDPSIKRFSSKNQIWRAAKAILTGPSILVERLYKPSDSSILHGPNLSGERLVAWSKGIDLDFVKKMKNAAGMTVNDVLMACLAGAFRDYFKAHASHVPQGILCSVPVDIRKPGSKLVLDNQFALVFLTLPTDIDDPIETLKETKQRMDFIKVSGEPIVNALSLRYCMARLPNWITRPLFDSLSDKCTTVLSNVPGPQEKLMLAGKAIERVVFWPPGRSKVGLSVSILSYCGEVTMGIIVDKVLLSNPSLLVTSFEEKVHELAKALNVVEGEKKDEFFVPTEEE